MLTECDGIVQHAVDGSFSGFEALEEGARDCVFDGACTFDGAICILLTNGDAFCAVWVTAWCVTALLVGAWEERFMLGDKFVSGTMGSGSLSGDVWITRDVSGVDKFPLWSGSGRGCGTL